MNNFSLQCYSTQHYTAAAAIRAGERRERAAGLACERGQETGSGLDAPAVGFILSRADSIEQVAAVAQSLSAMTKDRDAAVGQVGAAAPGACHVAACSARHVT
jgi:hypothetical protein